MLRRRTVIAHEAALSASRVEQAGDPGQEVVHGAPTGCNELNAEPPRIARNAAGCSDTQTHKSKTINHHTVAPAVIRWQRMEWISAPFTFRALELAFANPDKKRGPQRCRFLRLG